MIFGCCTYDVARAPTPVCINVAKERMESITSEDAHVVNYVGRACAGGPSPVDCEADPRERCGLIFLLCGSGHRNEYSRALVGQFGDATADRVCA